MTMNTDKPSYNEPTVNGTIKDTLGNEYEVVDGIVGHRIDQQEVMVDDTDQRRSDTAGVAGVRLIVEPPASDAEWV